MILMDKEKYAAWCAALDKLEEWAAKEETAQPKGDIDGGKGSKKGCVKAAI